MAASFDNASWVCARSLAEAARLASPSLSFQRRSPRYEANSGLCSKLYSHSESKKACSATPASAAFVEAAGFADFGDCANANEAKANKSAAMTRRLADMRPPGKIR